MSELRHYNKPPLSIHEQIKLLESRGLIVSDHQRAHHYLQYISYYRFSIYTRSFQAEPASNHQFQENTRFDDVLDRYKFDRELRLLLLDAIERIEIAIRATISYEFSMVAGANWYADADLFRDSAYFHHQQEMQHIQRLCSQSKEAFMQHHQNTYVELPPSWKLVEAMTLGEIIRLYTQMDARLQRVKDARYRIAKKLGVSSTLLMSWLKPLALLRNICAHHGYIWNRKLIYRPQTPRNPHIPWVKHDIADKQKLYIYLCMIQSLMQRINPHNTWKQRLFTLLNKYENIPQKAMGFPQGWEKDGFWYE